MVSKAFYVKVTLVLLFVVLTSLSVIFVHVDIEVREFGREISMIADVKDQNRYGFLSPAYSPKEGEVMLVPVRVLVVRGTKRRYAFSSHWVGEYQDWHANGQIKSHGTFDDTGRRIGIWEYWLSDGKRSSVGSN